MAEALILDSEAVTALAYPSKRAVLARRASAILRLAHDRRALVRIPAPVLAEVCRGTKQDAAINLLLSNPGIQVFELTRPLAQRAGHLLEQHKLSSAHAVDAFVVSTALHFDAAVIATCDPRDMQRLAAPFPRIGILAL
jgi:predicted nucleic acid-binding protein